MSALPVPYLTPKQYLEIEQKAEFKSEYWNGQMYAMAGGTPRHSEAGTRFAAALISRLGDGCGVFNSDLRLRDSEDGLYTYPDVSVVCGEPKYGEAHTLTNPILLAEVLSKSTEASDRGFKFKRYQHLESLKEYVLISQEEPCVETYLREPDGKWSYQSVEGLRRSVTLRSIGVEVPLSEIYRGITFRTWFTTDPGA